MRNRETIEREIYRAREDLEENLAELKHAVRDKVDVGARARVAIEKGKMAAQEAFEIGKTRASEVFDVGKTKAQAAFTRGKDEAADLYVKAKDRPALVAAVAGGVIAVGALVYVGRRRDWW